VEITVGIMPGLIMGQNYIWVGVWADKLVPV
jgi:hypothetical protein